MSMCRLNRIDKARKPVGKCGSCGKELGVGDPYLWWKGRYTPKYIRCVDHPPQPWQRETNPIRSEYMQAEYSIPSGDDEITAEEAFAEIESAISIVEGVRDSLQERVDAWQDTNLANSAQCEACTNTIYELDDWLSSAEDVNSRLSSLEEDPEPTGDEEDDRETVADVLADLTDLPDLDLGA